MSEHVHWSMREGARELDVRVRESKCTCDEGKLHVEGGWPIHGWAFHSGQCCDCLNIRVYDGGAEPDDFESNDPVRVAYADEHSDEIHICDLEAFIEMLQAIRKAKLEGAFVV